MFRSILLRLRNCHEVLGISPQASRQELKHRYHELARSLHPDVSSGEVQPGAQFAELREAYEACLRLARPRRHARPGSPMSSGAAAAGKAGSTGSAGSAGGTLFGGFPTTPPHLRTTFPGAWTNFRPKALNGGTYQGQPWKWRIRGPLTLSAQRKGSFTMRRWDGKDWLRESPGQRQPGHTTWPSRKSWRCQWLKLHGNGMCTKFLVFPICVLTTSSKNSSILSVISISWWCWSREDCWFLLWCSCLKLHQF